MTFRTSKVFRQTAAKNHFIEKNYRCFRHTFTLSISTLQTCVRAKAETLYVESIMRARLVLAVSVKLMMGQVRKNSRVFSPAVLIDFLSSLCLKPDRSLLSFRFTRSAPPDLPRGWPPGAVSDFWHRRQSDIRCPVLSGLFRGHCPAWRPWP